MWGTIPPRLEAAIPRGIARCGRKSFFATLAAIESDPEDFCTFHRIKQRPLTMDAGSNVAGQ